MQIKRTYLLTTTFTGPWYPGFLSGRDSVAGMRSGGINDLVDELEKHLGLWEKPLSLPERVIATEKMAREYLETHYDAFFAKSFQADPEGASLRLLQWRDTLLMGGWDGNAAALPPRIAAAMGVYEGPDGSSVRGMADRIIAIIDALEKNNVPVFDELLLVREAENEDALIQRLIRSLEACGTVVRQWPLAAPASNSGDCNGALSRLRDGKKFSPAGDMSLLLLTGRTEYECAEALASWLSINREQAVLIAGPESRGELDAALARRHQPAIGYHETSTFRGPLQALRLFLALQWEPLDPMKLLEYLLLPLSPLPQWAGRRLAKVLAKYPGIGGPRWNEEIAECIKSKNEQLKKENNSEKDRDYKLAAFMERLNFWLPRRESLVPYSKSIPLVRVNEICTALATWARKYYRSLGSDGENEEERELKMLLLREAAAQADRLGELMALSGMAEADFHQLMKWADAASGQGMTVPVRNTEEGSVFTVSSPAAIMAESPVVVWWDFSAQSAEPLPERLFTAVEMQSLQAAGIKLKGTGEVSLERSRYWRRALCYAGKRLVLATFEAESGERREAHPLWNEITAGLSEAEITSLTVTAGSILRGDTNPLGLPLEEREPMELPAPRREWRLKNLSPSLRGSESASSIENLVRCPFQYAVKYQAGIYPSNTITLEKEVLLQGTIAHGIIEELFNTTDAIWQTCDTAEKVSEKAGAIFDRSIAEEGAIFLLPGRETELETFRNSVLLAAVELWKLLRNNGLSIRSIEESFETDTEIGTMNGRLDLLLEDQASRQLIMDMKYSFRGIKSYSEKIKNGEAIQLAVYSRLAGQGTPGGYMSIQDGQFAADETVQLQGVQNVKGPSLKEVWTQLAVSVKGVQSGQLGKGFVLAAGVEDPESGDAVNPTVDGGLPQLDPQCQWCDYAAVCGKAWASEEGVL